MLAASDAWKPEDASETGGSTTWNYLPPATKNELPAAYGGFRFRGSTKYALDAISAYS